MKLKKAPKPKLPPLPTDDESPKEEAQESNMQELDEESAKLAPKKQVVKATQNFVKKLRAPKSKKL